MLKKYLTISFAIIALLFAYGCKDDEPTNPGDPNQNKPKFVFKTGSYWVFDNYDLDEANVRDLNSKYTDTTVVSGTKVLFGRTATIFTTYSDGDSTETYYAVDSNKLYVTSEFIDPNLGIDIPIEIPAETWFLIADYDQVEWSLFSQDIKDFEIEINTIKAKVSGTFEIKGKKITSQSVKWGADESKNIDATNFQLIYSFNGTAIVFGLPAAFSILITNNIYHNTSAGIVKAKRESQKIKVASFDLQTIYGFETVLLDYMFIN